MPLYANLGLKKLICEKKKGLKAKFKILRKSMFQSNFLSYTTHGTHPFYRCVKSINYYYFGGSHVGLNKIG